MTDLMKTASEWIKETDKKILDPDGWRYENGKHGQRWGTESGFYKSDYTDQNEHLLLAIGT